MPRVTYTGKSPDGYQYAFLTDQMQPFTAYVDKSLESTIAGIAPNTQIDVEYASKVSKKSGKQYYQVNTINGQRAAGGNRGGGGNRSYDPKAFVTGVCSSAITAGVIKKPEDLAEWANEAYKVMQGLGPNSARAAVEQAAGTAPAATPPQPATTPGEPLNDAIPF